MTKTSTLLRPVYLMMVFLSAVLVPETSCAQVSMENLHTSYNQNFNTLPDSGTAVWTNGSSYIDGWFIQRTKQNSTIVANNGSSNTGALYSYGANGSKERALGAVSSLNAGEFAWGLLLQNNTGSTIDSLDISFYGEQWRISNKTAGEHKISFFYAISDKKEAFDLSPRADANWTLYAGLDFKSPHYFAEGKRLDGNASGNRRLMQAVLAVEIPDGYYLMLRWKDADELEADHGLAIDDFSLSWFFEPDEPIVVLPVELVQFIARNSGSFVQLQWKTASELNNKYFSVERSANGRGFESIGQLAGYGTTVQGVSYTFADEYPLPGISYYRLKQVDEDDQYTYSTVVSVMRGVAARKAIVYPTLTSSTLQISTEQAGTLHKLMVVDVMGRQVLQKALDKNTLHHNLDVSQLTGGTYVLVLLDEQGQRQTTRFLKR